MEERFMKYVKKEDLGCWSWIGGKSTNGYGHFSVGGKGSPGKIAHRVSFELFKHEIPKGMWVLHTCRNKCVNPEHLVIGNAKQNNKDDKIRDGTLCIGTKNPSSKYTEEQILTIRQRHLNGETQTSIAKSFGIRQGHISDICKKKVWKHI
jgi:hypothetical protein